MPERAAEARQAPDDIREELIAKAAELWTHVHSGTAAEVAGDGGVALPGRPGPGRWVTCLASLARTTGSSPSRT